MLKGLLALFTSGAIFNPMVLLGAAMAVFSMVKLNEEQIKALLTDWRIYLIAAVISLLHNFLFNKTYQDNGVDVNYGALVFNTLWGVFKFALTWLLTMSFIVMISF